MTRTICTIFTDSHLPQALALWESLRSYSSDWGFVALRVGCGELSLGVPREFRECCVDVSDLPAVHPGPRFWYDAFEYCNYVKAPLHDYMWSKSSADEWWYVDADCWFTDHPDRLSTQWRHASILLCPHRHTPYDSQDVMFLFYGTCNGGLLGVRRSNEAQRFVEWFVQRLTWSGFNEPTLGLFVDQKWLDLVPNYFSCDMVEDAGINVGYWNYSAEHVSGSTPVRLLHLSRVDLAAERVTLRIKGQFDEASRISFLGHAETYRKRIRHWDQLIGERRPYPYSTFHDGRPITKVMRRAYYCDVLDGRAPNDPFADSHRYENLAPRGVIDRFVAAVCPDAASAAGGLFGAKPSLTDVCEQFSEDELVGAMRLRKLLPAVCRRLFLRLTKAAPHRQ